ncbi:peptidase inhibitor family I36 protein [Nonomuraea diastatica]|uniref:Peptidase inhibitor family I36 protein n=1 Tax=Nonomuraea diastatica TaxID=1848329 RepID=A0A4V6PD61_9ACTN|nr:peptidase inhibitor family I36 protein [Nonomuraea diastatica]TDD23107.1 hypothetical protein E1294_09735 [Nonomuraea diastatica]
MPRPAILARLLTGAALATATVGTLGLPAAAAPARVLPPGVIHLGPVEPCPPATLCLYRDYGRNGPAYGIGAGYDVDLRALPMPGGVGGPSAADNASSWVNATGSVALLIDRDGGLPRPLFPGRSLEEPPASNDSVDVVAWPR